MYVRGRFCVRVIFIYIYIYVCVLCKYLKNFTLGFSSSVCEGSLLFYSLGLQDDTLRWAIKICVLSHRSMDVPKKVSLPAMLLLLKKYVEAGHGQGPWGIGLIN